MPAVNPLESFGVHVVGETGESRRGGVMDLIGSRSVGLGAAVIGALSLLAGGAAAADAPGDGAPTVELRTLVTDGAKLTRIDAPTTSLTALDAPGGPLTRLDKAPVMRLGPADAFVDLDRMMAATDPVMCLAEAVYFEARSESYEGQEAVAQVVMNRTHMATYPSSVCGVVFQGWERTTGCQFTFVCDGSLREPSDMVAWERATEIAKHALAGFVYKPMQYATHYHATWMTPYWEASLTRIGKIGGHVFFR
jgi:hypothetical protein